MLLRSLSAHDRRIAAALERQCKCNMNEVSEIGDESWALERHNNAYNGYMKCSKAQCRKEVHIQIKLLSLGKET